MINHIYIDNYKCFTNFEWKPGKVVLLLGDNGTGKSTVFDVLEKLRDFISKGTNTEISFPPLDLCSWLRKDEQTFEVGIEGNGGQYVYRLIIEHFHKNERRHSRIKLEHLTYDGNSIYKYDGANANLFKDGGAPGPVFPFDWSRTAIATIPERNENSQLTWFRRHLAKNFFLSTTPSEMAAVSEHEAQYPERHLGNFVSWLNYLHYSDFSFSQALMESMKQVIDGFVRLKLDPMGSTAKRLLVAFSYDNDKMTEFDISFADLSSGQKCLIALYSGLFVAKNSDVNVYWDEPDNYVSLREIQPWLMAIEELLDIPGKQCWIISHHPEYINFLAAELGVVFYRDTNGPVRVKPFEFQEGGIAPSDLVARGWE